MPQLLERGFAGAIIEEGTLVRSLNDVRAPFRAENESAIRKDPSKSAAKNIATGKPLCLYKDSSGRIGTRDA